MALCSGLATWPRPMKMAKVKREQLISNVTNGFMERNEKDGSI